MAMLEYTLGVCLLVAASSMIGCCGLEILQLQVPDVIQNYSRSSVILDCIYTYENYERDGLVVKWHWNHEPEAVYQWIMGKKPEAVGILKGRVNLDYKASGDVYTHHRALEILHPTTELTGFFTCRVSSFHDEKFETKKMIVYAPATSMNMSYHKPSPSAVNITCESHGLYPKPKLMMYEVTSPQARSLVDEAKEHLVPTEEGFSIYLHALLEDRTMKKQEETMFECILSIPDTEYQVRRQVIYLPGYDAFEGLATGGAKTAAARTALFMLLSLIYL